MKFRIHKDTELETIKYLFIRGTMVKEFCNGESDIVVLRYAYRFYASAFPFDVVIRTELRCSL